MCLELYEPDPTNVLPAPGLSWLAALKKTKLKLDLLTEIDMLLMVEKGIRAVTYPMWHKVLQYKH